MIKERKSFCCSIRCVAASLHSVCDHHWPGLEIIVMILFTSACLSRCCSGCYTMCAHLTGSEDTSVLVRVSSGQNTQPVIILSHLVKWVCASLFPTSSAFCSWTSRGTDEKINRRFLDVHRFTRQQRAWRTGTIYNTSYRSERHPRTRSLTVIQCIIYLSSDWVKLLWEDFEELTAAF